jgi:hypothetical protein
MAQKQAEALRKDRFDGTDVLGDERLSVFNVCSAKPYIILPI